MENQFSCYIICETTLGTQCAEEIFNLGHQVLGIISPHPESYTWTKKNNVPLFASLNEFQSLVSHKSFDYLFSIVNGHILEDDILKLPRHCAIKFQLIQVNKFPFIT